MPIKEMEAVNSKLGVCEREYKGVVPNTNGISSDVGLWPSDMLWLATYCG